MASGGPASAQRVRLGMPSTCPCADSTASTYTASGRSRGAPRPGAGDRHPSRRSIRTLTCCVGLYYSIKVKSHAPQALPAVEITSSGRGGNSTAAACRAMRYE